MYTCMQCNSETGSPNCNARISGIQNRHEVRSTKVGVLSLLCVCVRGCVLVCVCALCTLESDMLTQPADMDKYGWGELHGGSAGVWYNPSGIPWILTPMEKNYN